MRATAIVAVLCVLAAACTGSGDDPSPTPGEATTDATEVAPTAEASTEADVTALPVAPGAELDGALPPEVAAAAADWIATESGLSAMLQEEIFLAEVIRTRDVLHLRFVQQHDDVSVRGAQFVLHVREDGEVLGSSSSLSEVLPADDATEELTPDAAAEIATKAVTGTIVGEPEVVATWVESGTALRLAWEVAITTEDPLAAWAVVVDATDGTVLRIDQRGTDRAAAHRPAAAPRGIEVAQAGGCAAPPAPSACVFPVDPYSAAGTLDVPLDAANRFLTGVPLDNLTDPAGGQLVGAHAAVAPETGTTFADPDGVWGEQGRGGDPSFEAGMTYYWIDRTQQLVAELGFDYHADDPVHFIPVDPRVQDNAFYLPTTDTIHMGVGRGGVNTAEDAQIIIHEYGHAILEAVVPGIVSGEGGAFHEGFADLVNAFTTLQLRNGDPACLFAWATQGQCLRRVDRALSHPADVTFEVHADAEIYTGAVWDVFEAVLARDTGLTPDDCQDPADPCGAVRDTVFATLLGSLPFLSPRLTLPDAAVAFAAADQVLFGGANAAEIAAGFAAHGFSVGATDTVDVEGLPPTSDPTAPAAGDPAVTVKIDHPHRGDLRVDLTVVDAAGRVLCGGTVVEPVASDAAANISGRARAADLGCEAFLPPGPDRIWALTVVDTAAGDVGQVLRFQVEDPTGVHLAPGLPVQIPDGDPIGVTVGIGGQAPGEAPPDVGEEGAVMGAVTVGFAVTHTYAGDLQIRAAVVDGATGAVRCAIPIANPNLQDASADPRGTVDGSACAAFLPPTPEQPWVLHVVDTAPADTGTITAFGVRGPDGREHVVQGAVAIPDADPAGAVLVLSG